MLGTSYPSEVFRGVQFALFGFNPITESKVRFKLVNGGAVDVGKYSGNCTHVIVDEIAYDDPVCVAARNDGRTLVTSLWVDHSTDIGMPVDASSVMYRPLKDLNGIPGAQNLIVCLTGYLRQDRDDIMVVFFETCGIVCHETMVNLMGAQFSKPLVANKVTHLICYKFEGEKYELARRLETIKLVNHRWLEDCLKEWALLPEDDYSKSGYELEMIAAHAKDSEEEAEDSELGQSGGRNISKSPLGSKFDVGTSHDSSKSAREVSNAFPDSTGQQVLQKVNKGKESSVIQGNKNKSDRDLSFSHVDDQKVISEAPDVSVDATSCQLLDTHIQTSVSKNADFPVEPSCQDLGIPENTNSHVLVSDLHASNSESKKLVSDMRSTRESTEGVAYSDGNLSATSYSRKKQKGFTLPRNLNECLRNETGPSVSPLADLKFSNKHLTSSSKVEDVSEGIKSTCVDGYGDEPSSILPQKKVNGASSNKLKSRKTTADAKLSIKRMPSANGKSQGLKRASLVDEPPKAEGCLSVGKDGSTNPTTSSVSKSTAPNFSLMEFDEPFSRNANSKSAEIAVQSLTVTEIDGRPDITSHGMGQVDGNEAEQHNVTETLYLSPSNMNVQNEESTGPTLDISNEESNKLTRRSPRKKSVAKRSLGSNSRPKVGAIAKQKLSASLSKTIQQDEAATYSSGIQDAVDCDVEKLHASPLVPDVMSMEQKAVSKYAEDADGRPETLDDETEAPDDKYELELGVALNEKKSDLDHLSNKVEETTEDKSEAIDHIAKCDEAVPPKEDANVSEKPKPPSTSSKSEVKHQVRKRATKKTAVSEKILKSKEAVSEDKVPKKRKHEAEIEETTEDKSEAIDHIAKCDEAVPPMEDANVSEKPKPSSTSSKSEVKHQVRKRPATKKTAVSKKILKSKEAVSEDKVPKKRKHEAEIEETTEDKSEAIDHIARCDEAVPPMEDANVSEKPKPSSTSSKSEIKHQVQKRSATKKTAVSKKILKSKEAVSEDKVPQKRKHEAEIEETTEDKSEAIDHIAKCDEAVSPMEDANVSEKPKPSSTSSKSEVKHQVRKRPATKKTAVSKKILKSKEAVSEDEVPKKRKHEAEIETLEETIPPADINYNSPEPRKKSEEVNEEDKENRPIDGEQETVDGQNVGNLNMKSSTEQAEISSKKVGLNPPTSEVNRRMKSEAPCFILSGHRLQRKEFQQAIKRLKGRVCRDSHQWSYQATHFIAPEPIRRTEKFFAAAASGRWILKTDFLTASIQAGKLLPEEPYEWHHNGLSEDGAIHMEAPRKWRLLKERTGHGAFYGMRIIVYGDCITPSLDTLKRVIKAGDGNILAKSPPYTRFLGTEIDYAIVSPGMPRVDVWVQEFLKHEIPCVSADYLVEYVCKPGSSIEKHVLYGTHAWAETSYAKLESRPKDVEELLTPQDRDSSNDTICQVCGSRDRGDVMLICGDESGSVGCGVGTHIDCCDPPLTDVPEEDWFCPKCSMTRNCSDSRKKRK